MRQECWNRFMETGSVADYLEYACTIEGGREEGTLYASKPAGLPRCEIEGSEEEGILADSLYASKPAGLPRYEIEGSEQVKEGEVSDRAGKVGGDCTDGSPVWRL